MAVWLPAPSGLQESLISDAPETYFRPPYVGGRGWIGVELDAITDGPLAIHVRDALEMISPKKLRDRGAEQPGTQARRPRKF